MQSSKKRNKHRTQRTQQPSEGGGGLQQEKIPQEKEYRNYATCSENEIRRRLIPEILQEFPERNLKLYGSRLPRCDQVLVKTIEAAKLPPLLVGSYFKSNTRQYKVEKVLGTRSYRLMDHITKGKFFMKMEPAGLPKEGPSLKRDILLLKNAFESSAPGFNQHFLQTFDRGSFPEKFNYVVFPLCDCNLSDFRSERLNGADFSRPTALYVASQTLQAIHDVQLHHYYHRDIRAGNFVVGLNENHHMIYIVGFSLSYEYVNRSIKIEQGKKPSINETPRITPKLPWISCRFQSRAFHLGQPIRRLDDVESWIYLVLDIFDRNMLPWKKAKNERIGYEQKERLFMGSYAEQLGDLKPYIETMMKFIESSRTKSSPVVDYPFFGNILEQMAADWKLTGKEPLDWMPDPCGYKNMPRVAEEAKTKEATLKKVQKQQNATTTAEPAVSLAPPPEDDFNLCPVVPVDSTPNEVAPPKDKPESKPEEAAKPPPPTDQNVNNVEKEKEKEENEKILDTAVTGEKNTVRKSTKLSRRRRGAAAKDVAIEEPKPPQKKEKDSETAKKNKKGEDESDKNSKSPKKEENSGESD